MSIPSQTTLPQPGRTLLPGPVAQAVSLATRSTCLAIKLGSAASSFGLDAARLTTLSSLELARGMVEGVLSRAGRDTLARSHTELSTMDAESVIERSLESLHQAMTQVVFWATAGFHLTSTTISVASDFSQLFLSSLDQFLGSTDSSRAIASIITLIRREFRDPTTGFEGDKVGVMDLVLGLCALAYLQQRCWRSAVEENHRREYEEVIWDVVVLNDGERVDVQGRDATSLHRPPSRRSQLSRNRASLNIKSKPSQVELRNGLGDEETVLQQLQKDIIESLPPDTSVTISNLVTTTQTITIDVDGPRPISLPSPPGAEIVEIKSPWPASAVQTISSQYDREGSPYRVVYRLEKATLGSSSFNNREDEARTSVIELLETKTAGAPARKEPSLVQPKKSPKASHAAKIPIIKPAASNVLTTSEVKAKRSSPNPPSATPVPRRLERNINEFHTAQKNARSSPSTLKQRPESEANQKKPRAPLNSVASRDRTPTSRQSRETARRVLPKRKTEPVVSTGKGTDKRGGLKQVLREGSQSFSNLWHKDPSPSDSKSHGRTKGFVDHALSVSLPALDPHGPLPVSSPSHDPMDNSMLSPRSPSRSSLVSVNERRRNSVISQPDSSSWGPNGRLRPASPNIHWHEIAAEPQSKASNLDDALYASSVRGHRRVSSHVPSIYSLASNDSQSSLVLSSYYQKSPYNAADALSILRRDGAVDGLFPQRHVLQNITRYMRFSSASYGSNFLKLLGISKQIPTLKAWDGLHSDVRHFVYHTESDTGSILLASIVDPQGGTDSSGSTGTGMPLVHYISLDHNSKAVVLACRGTLGFEDVLADMTCDYDILTWRGRPYKVHKGVHASARRLLYGEDGRVLITLREALVEFPDYGIILCGHSLGGAVTALLGVMLAEPNPTGTGFVTVSEPKRPMRHDPSSAGSFPVKPSLPPGRPIHVYAYGPPGTMSASLCKLTRGLITTVVHGNDLVPYLSLGLLHDFKEIALAFKQDQHQAKMEIRARLWQALQGGIADKWYHKSPRPSAKEEAEWGLPVLKALRASMTNLKLLPPGEVFSVESQKVLRRDAFLLQDEDNIGRPARRIVLKYVKDVETRFREVRWGASMLVDHSPANYEEALNKLQSGVAC